MNIKNLKLMIFMLILLTVPTFVNADVCTDAAKDAASVKLRYEFFYNEDDVGYFKIKVNNVKNNITVYTDYGEPITNGEYDVMALDTLQEIKLPIYANLESCSNPVYEISLTLPLYNDFSDYNICKDIEDYKYCQPLIEENITHNQLRKNIESYRDKLEKEEKIKEVKEDEAYKVLNSEEEKSSTDSLMLVIVLLSLVILLTIVIIIYKRKKKRMVM